MKKRYLWIGLFLLVFLGLSQLYFRAEADHSRCSRLLPTLYDYPTEELCHLNSTTLIQEEKLNEWETALCAFFEEHNIDYFTQLHFYTYLYLAQKDAAFLSYNVHQCFIGSLDPLTEKVVKYFFPSFNDGPEIVSDLYSEKLAAIVFSKYLNRLEKENLNPNQFPNVCKVAEEEKNVAKWIPWISSLPHLPAPPSKENKCVWEQQVKELKKSMQNLSPTQEALMHEWEGNQGLAHRWHIVSNCYMEENCTPFAKVLLVRAVLTMGLHDALYATLLEKYTYCTSRPSKIDPSLHLTFKNPDTPSYPSGHATMAAAAGAILAYFFSCDCPYWQNLAEEVAESRLWAGVHFPIDKMQGQQLGEEIGKIIVRCFTE